MSHIVQIKTQVTDEAAITAACARLNLPEPTTGTFDLFSGQKATGVGVMLPNWQYPVVCNTETGEVAFDNYNGRWGKQVELDKFLQAYTIEKATSEARSNGYTVGEELLEDGSIKLNITVESY